MKGCLRFIAGLFIIAVVIVGFLGYIGLIPAVAKFFGSDKPQDLGVKYTDKILLETRTKSGVEIKKMTDTDNPADTISYMGKHAVGADFSSEELTAVVNSRPWKYNPVEGVQIKITGDTLEASGYVLTDKVLGFVMATGGSKFDLSMVMKYLKIPSGKLPFYIKTTGDVKNNNVSLNPLSLKAGRLPIPINLVNKYKPQGIQFIEERVDFTRGLSIESLTLTDGKMRFKGTLPDLEGLTP